MTKANYSLRLQPSLKTAAEKFAAVEGTSLNQFINVAVAEKLAVMIFWHFWMGRGMKRLLMEIGFESGGLNLGDFQNRHCRLRRTHAVAGVKIRPKNYGV
jgi:hypothetical protein